MYISLEGQVVKVKKKFVLLLTSALYAYLKTVKLNPSHVTVKDDIKLEKYPVCHYSY